MTPPKPAKDGEQLFEQIILTTERNLAKRLGNSDRLEKWQRVKFFKAARREWLDAWKRFARAHGLGSVLKIRAGAQQTLEPMKDFTLAMLRLSGEPEETVKNQAGVIHAAASAGDIEFFKQFGLALRSASRAKRQGAILAYSILCYWFAGLLWLMNDKAGWAALCDYTRRKDITKAAYRKACHRLGLKGYKDRMRRPAVLYYDPVTGTYKYGSAWTRMEPHLST